MYFLEKVNSRFPFHSLCSSTVDITDISRDGKEYKRENTTVLFSADYAVSVFTTHHQRTLFSLIDLLSEIGGLASAIFVILGIVGKRINAEFLKNKITRILYFIKT